MHYIFHQLYTYEPHPSSLFINMPRTLKPKPTVPSEDSSLVAPQTPSSTINRRDPAPRSGPISKTFNLLPRNPRTIRKLYKIKAPRRIPSSSTKKKSKFSSTEGTEGTGDTGGTAAETYTLEPSQQESVSASPWSTHYSAISELTTTESEANSNTETVDEDAEKLWSAHIMGEHVGRDRYELVSKRYLDAGLPPPWKRCPWCEETIEWLLGKGVI
ncbi:hypothetical protein COCCADRAFT_82308 [Bipolaris zeicola 26-R-13]|uniref:Uncharacterized protein n=1 Tax=Cochliobolus carbonum (strain 26-R-13) TaxID=930089 RepID=W6Z575_COCC2|nr:uncharacterized protein COCCADRAFT_82308 [Bipolaris zeicola 26-R-13]EUC38841.1 hypothetical protein COCCADRAFT_82308 [Bipolaris zeicola 26-R-13]